MSMHFWIRKLFHRSGRAKTITRPRSRLSVEILEDRLVPTGFTVTDTSDSASDAGSIRYAIDNLAVGSSSTTNTISITTTGTITLTAGELAITQGVTITGPGASELTISGNNAFRVLDVASDVTVAVSGLTLTAGLADGGNGGAVINAGTLTLQNCAITASEAEGGTGTANPSGFGGGIANSASLTLISSTVSGDTALGGNGGGLTAAGGGGGGAGLGGGIFNSGTLMLTASTITGDAAIGGTGGIGVYPGSTLTNGTGGGAGGAGGNPGGTGGLGGGGGGGSYGGDAGGIGGFGGGGGGSGGISGDTGVAGGAGGTYGGAGGPGILTGGGGGGGGAGVGGGLFNLDGSVIFNSGSVSGNTAIGGKAGASGTNRTGANGMGVEPEVFNDVNDGGTVSSSISFGSPSVTQWTVNHAGFSSSIAITGVAPFSLSSSSGLPPGLTAAISGSTIIIAGTPSSAGTFSSCMVGITDALGGSATTTFSLTINPALSIGTLSQTQWNINQSGFDGTLAVSGGTTPYTLTAQSGLPPGLTAVLSGSTISFTGTPTSAGTFSSGSVTVMDSSGASTTQTFSITIIAALALGNLTVTQWTQDQAGFGGILPITGGVSPYTLTAQSGLPTGLTAVISGNSVAFTGTPSAIGAFTSGSVTIEDDDNATVTQTFSITINAPATVGSLTQTQWTVNHSGFDGILAISGGTGPFTLTAQSGLPTGLVASLSGTTISFTGTPTIATTFASGSVTVKDSSGATITQTFSITINPAPVIGALSPTEWTVNQPNYDGTMTITGGTGPFILTGATGFPPGLSVAVNGTTISVTGTPDSIGVYSGGTISIEDVSGATATQFAGVTINADPSVGSLTVSRWTVNQAGFSGTIPILGGTGPYTVMASSGLPTGLTAVISGNSIAFTGTPTVPGTFASGSVTIADAAGAEATTQTFSITINPLPTLGSLTPSQWTVNQPGFPGTATISGGTGPFTLTAQSGLPTGLTATLSGTTIHFTGTPTAIGAFTGGSVTIKDSGGATISLSVCITINAPPTIGSLSQTEWTVHESGFTGTLAISGGTSAFTLTAQSGLPTGLTATLSGTTISFTGTPTAVGTFPSGKVTIKDAAGVTVTQTFSITIVQAPTIGNLTLTQWTLDQGGFTGTLPVSNGTVPFTVTFFNNLPPGLTAVVSGTSIGFTGTPTAAGTFSDCTVTITDLAGATATKTFTITINPVPTIGSLTQTLWTVNAAGFNGTLAVSGGTTPYILTAQSGLPTGLTAVLSGTTIKFTGTPTALGTFSSGTVTIEDAAGAYATAYFSITINSGPTLGPLTTTVWTAGLAGFTGTVAISGAPPFTITASSGIPPGLTPKISGSTIYFTGTPTTAGTFSHGSITIKDVSNVTATVTFSITINPALVLAATSLPAWKANTAYTATVTSTGGTGPVTFAITGGSLPPGFTLASDGVISGTTTSTTTSFSVTITATDSLGEKVSRTYTLSNSSGIRIGTRG